MIPAKTAAIAAARSQCFGVIFFSFVGKMGPIGVFLMGELWSPGNLKSNKISSKTQSILRRALVFRIFDERMPPCAATYESRSSRPNRADSVVSGRDATALLFGRCPANA